MFTATTTKKDFRGGVFQVTVDFVNGEETITEAFNIISEADLDNKIKNRLKVLNELAGLETKLKLGTWTKKEKPVEPILEPTPLELATQTLYRLKEKINLGVLKETDQEFVDAVNAYKTAVSNK